MDRYRQDWLVKGCEPSDANAGKVKQRSDQCTDDEVIVPDNNQLHEIDEPEARSKAAKQHQESDGIPIISHQDHITGTRKCVKNIGSPRIYENIFT